MISPSDVKRIAAESLCGVPSVRRAYGILKDRGVRETTLLRIERAAKLLGYPPPPSQSFSQPAR